MAGSPIWKVYDSSKKYQASLKEVEAAAALVSFYGNGATIRYGHSRVVWTEGSEAFPAGESFDLSSELAYKRAMNREVK